MTSTENGTTLELTDNLTLTSNTLLSIKVLTLNDNTLTLGSERSGLIVGGPINLDHTDEKILGNAADLNLKGLLIVDGRSAVSVSNKDDLRTTKFILNCIPRYL